jgi:hypothetical protein
MKQFKSFLLLDLEDDAKGGDLERIEPTDDSAPIIYLHLAPMHQVNCSKRCQKESKIYFICEETLKAA